MKSFIDVQISLPVSGDELAGLLGETGILGVWEHDGLIHLYWDDSKKKDQVLVVIQEAVQQLGMSLKSDEITIHAVLWQDWNAKWAELVEPIQIGERIIVRPSWTKVPLSEHAIELILDPKQAFGTGHHITTQLLGEWLEDRIRGGERVLDVGTGSGLLAMIALRLGAQSALGVDIDPIAIECAKEYAEANHFGEELELRTEDFRYMENERYDLILANLDRRTLLVPSNQFPRVAGSSTTLLLTGILDEDQSDVIAKCVSDGWSLAETRAREGWLAIRFYSG